MRSDEVRAARLNLGLSAEGFARLLRVQGGRTVRKWEAADRGVSGPVAVLTTALMESKEVRDYFGVRLLVESTGSAVPKMAMEPSRGMSGKKQGMESLMTFGMSYVTTKMREAANGAAKLVANFDPQGATEAQIEEAHKKVDELASMAAGAMTKAEADQRIADAAKAEYNKYKTAAIATNAQIEAGDTSKQSLLDKLLGMAEKLKPQVEDAQHTATDSMTWYEETKGYHEQAVQQWTGMRTALDNARRDLDRSKQQEQQETRMAGERERAAGLVGRGTGNVALDAMQAAAADAKQHAAAAHLTNMALGHASSVDDDVAAALAAADKGGAPAPSAASRLANL